MKLLPLILTVTALCVPNSHAATNEEALALNITPRPAKLTQQIEQALAAKGADYQPRTEHLRVDGSPKFTNRLILEDSPYLIQHAHKSDRLVPLGAGGFRRRQTRKQAGVSFYWLFDLPLVSRHGARKLRERGHRYHPQPVFHPHQSRS